MNEKRERITHYDMTETERLLDVIDTAAALIREQRIDDALDELQNARGVLSPKIPG